MPWTFSGSILRPRYKPDAGALHHGPHSNANNWLMITKKEVLKSFFYIQYYSSDLGYSYTELAGNLSDLIRFVYPYH